MKHLNGKMPETDRKLSQRLLPVGINLAAFAIFAGVAIALRASVTPVNIAQTQLNSIITLPVITNSMLYQNN